MDPFNAWDIYVETNSSVLNPVSLSVAGNMLGSVFELANCINGVGTGCTINDGAGMAHSEAADNTGIDIGGSGLLFTITYKVAGSGYSFLRIPAGLNTIASSGSAVIHSTVGGAYGNPPSLPVADFTFSPTMPVLGDKVTFDASLSSDPNAGARLVSYAWTIAPLLGGIPTNNVTSQPIMVHSFRVQGGSADFSVTLIVTDNLGLSSAPVNKIVTVLAPPDFSISVNVVLLAIPPGHSATLSLTLKTANGFTGDVTLSVNTQFGLLILFSQNPIALTSNTLTTVVVTVTVHAGPGERVFYVTATHGDLVHLSGLIYVITSRPQANAPL